jgi:general secretion pathway protein I
LLEVMLAFVLLAVALGLLMGMLSGGLKQVNEAGRATEATLHAQSLLDALGALEPIVPGTKSGEFDDGRYRWTLAVEPTDDPAPLSLDAGPPPAAPLEGGPRLYRVALDIEWNKGGPRERLRYVTLRARTPAEVGSGQ